MKKILYVEDDVLIAHVYTRKLSEAGYEVEVAEDGLEAMKRLQTFRPDVVVLDLLMPKFTGIDVLKFIRRTEGLRDVRVIIFSNSFLSNLVDEVATSTVERALVKSTTTPSELIRTVEDVLAKGLSRDDGALSAAELTADAPEPSPPSPDPATRAADSPRPVAAARESPSKFRDQFLEHRPGLIKTLLELCESFVEAEGTSQELPRIEDLVRKVRFLAQMAGMAEAHRIAQLSSALEAMLFDLYDKNNYLNGSSRQTVTVVVAQLIELLKTADHSEEPPLQAARILVVDDDAVSNRALVLALGRAQLSAISTTDPYVAHKRLQDESFDLVLMDVNMPGLDGFSLCKQLRAMPHQKRTTVVFVTGYDDYKSRAQSILSGGDDLITKPIMPIEVCVKAVSHLIKRMPVR